MNVLELLSLRGLEVRQSSSNENEFKICCIFCSDMGESPDYRFRCGFNVQSGFGHCFNCGWSSHKAILEIVRKLGIDGMELEEIRQMPFTRKTQQRPEVVEYPKDFSLLWDLRKGKFAIPAWEYVRQRGITDEQIRKYEVGLAPYDDTYCDRIVFPVKDPEDKLMGFVGRDYTGKRFPKYLNSNGLKVLYNSNPLKYPKKWMLLSEGIIKAYAIERAVENKICSSALLGSFITDVKLSCMEGFEEVIIFPDPDRAGIKGALGVAENLISQKKVSIVWPWPTKQADEMGPKEIRKLILGRVPYTRLLRQKLRLELLKK